MAVNSGFLKAEFKATYADGSIAYLTIKVDVYPKSIAA